MRPQIKKILYTTDLTENSVYAFNFALDLARTHDARIVILHCVNPIPQAYGEPGFGFEAVAWKAKELEKQYGTDEIKKRIGEFCQKMEQQSGVPCVDLVSEILVDEGYPADAILTTADDKMCDAIILGTHGKGWLSRTFLGSIALSVIKRTRKPTFLIPLPSDKKTIAGEIKKILYATDLTENSAYAFYFASALASAHDAHIIILHCMEPIRPELYQGTIVSGEEIMKKTKELEREDDLAELRKRIDEFCRTAESRTGLSCAAHVSDIVVKEGYPVEEILNTADARGCDVIILGTHGKGWLSREFLGSVALSVVERTSKPTFLIPLLSDRNN